MNAGQLNSIVIAVKLGERELYFDPGMPHVPFGMLPWNETGVTGLRVGAEGGEWVETPVPAASESRIDRKADLRLTAGGSLEGKVTVAYTGLEASTRRVAERNEDEAHRNTSLEQAIRRDMPSAIDVKLINSPDWKGTETPLVAEYDLKIPSWTAVAGQRALLAMGLFGGVEKHMFEHAARVHPLNFEFPYQHTDDVTIELPAGWQASSVPAARTADLKGVRYSTAAEAINGSLHLRRELTLNFIYVEPKLYPPVHEFFQTVRAGDADQVVMSTR
jgi:hypothetical protein